MRSDPFLQMKGTMAQLMRMKESATEGEEENQKNWCCFSSPLRRHWLNVLMFRIIFYVSSTIINKYLLRNCVWNSFMNKFPYYQVYKCTVVAKLFWWCHLSQWVSCRNTILRNSLMATELPLTATFLSSLSCVNLRSSN